MQIADFASKQKERKIKEMPKSIEMLKTVPDSLSLLRSVSQCENEVFSFSRLSALLIMTGQRHECSVSSAIFGVVKGFASVVVVPQVAEPVLSHASDNYFLRTL